MYGFTFHNDIKEDMNMGKSNKETTDGYSKEGITQGIHR